MIVRTCHLNNLWHSSPYILLHLASFSQALLALFRLLRLTHLIRVRKSFGSVKFAYISVDTERNISET
jgi:hypothetical protein